MLSLCMTTIVGEVFSFHFYHFQVTVPIVFRGPNGAAAGVAAQHSQCYAAWYGAIPGLKVSM